MPRVKPATRARRPRISNTSPTCATPS